MKPIVFRHGLLLTLCLCLPGCWWLTRVASQTKPTVAVTTPPPPSPADAPERLQQAYGQLPLAFEANAGQFTPGVQFAARGAGYNLWLTPDEVVWQLRQPGAAGSAAAVKSPSTPSLSPAQVRLRFSGARPAAWQGLEPVPRRSHYFLGNDARHWRTGVANFAQVKQSNVYPGVDVVWYGHGQQLEYDLIVNPGARPSQIKLAISGITQMRTVENGALEWRLQQNSKDLSGARPAAEQPGTVMRMLPPAAWQEIAGERRAVSCLYRVHASREVTFELGAYDQTRPLVIDPVLAYSTLLGGTGIEMAQAIAVDAQGNAYITGTTDSPDFPGMSPLQANPGGQTDVFVAKLNPTGTALVWATWLGGSFADVAEDIKLDAAGNVYVAGSTSSANFPVKNAFQSELKASDGFVTKLDSTGSMLVYSTFLGGTGNDSISSLAVDAEGSAYLTGSTGSYDFPTVNPLQANKRGDLLYVSTNGGTQWNPANGGLRVSNVNDIALDPANALTIYAATDRGVFKTTDGGTSWAQAGAAQISANTIQLVIHPATPQTLYAIAANSLYRSLDGGENWTRLTPVGTPRFLVLDPNAPDNLYLVTTGMLKSTDGGTTWLPVSIPGVGSGMQIRAFTVDPLTANTLYLGTSQGFFLKTTNGGANWAPVGTSFPELNQSSALSRLKISRSNPAVLYLMSSSSFLARSSDGGATWQFPSLPAAVGLSATLAFELDPANANVVYVGNNGVYKTTDGGATWTLAAEGLGGGPVRVLTVSGTAPQTVYAGVNLSSEAFLSKLNPSGATLVFSTYLGGSKNDAAVDVAVDSSGVYVAGQTNSPDFPLLNAYQNRLAGSSDAFVTKFNPAGTALLWSTLLGGTALEFAQGLALNASGNAFITGVTFSRDFPIAQAVQAANASDSFSAAEAFVTRLSADGRQLDYSTYLGGSKEEWAHDIALDASGNVYLTGYTQSEDFPAIGALAVNPPSVGLFWQAFVTRLNAAGTAWDYSMTLGSEQPDSGQGIAVDAAGNAYVTGWTYAENFPTTPGALRRAGLRDAFVTKLAASADLALTITDVPDPAQFNSRMFYTVTVTNHGPDAASAVQLSYTLPPTVEILAITPSTGSCTRALDLTCNLGTLAANARATITVGLGVGITTELNLSGTVTSATADRNPNNNSATEQTRVGTQPAIYGRVTLADRTPLANVRMTLHDTARAPVNTASDGTYQFTELASGSSYTVRPALSGYVFMPRELSFANLTLSREAYFTAEQCLYTLTPHPRTFPATGGTANITLMTNNASCPWTARSNASWIKLQNADANGVVTGQSNTELAITVEPTNRARSGTLTIAGQLFTVFQEFYACAEARFPSTALLPGVELGQIRSAVKGDFNQDGREDVAWLETGVTVLRVAVALALADNSLAQPLYFGGLSSAAALFDLQVGDLNGDGYPDLAAVGSLSSSTYQARWWLNKGAAGGFAAGQEQPLSFRPSTLALGDYNSDGRPDLLITVFDTEQALLGLPNDGAGGFETPRNLLIRQTSSFDRIDLGDVDKDGKLDLFLSLGSDGYAVYRGDGAGGFTAQRTLGPASSGRAVGDFNGDGRPDVVFALAGELRLWLNDGAGGYPTAPAVVKLNPAIQLATSQLLASDFNADGRSDLLLAAFNGGSHNEGLLLLFGTRTGGFSAPEHYLSDLSFGRSLIFAAADVTRDGLPDVVTFDYNGQTSRSKAGLLIAQTGGGLVAPGGLALGELEGARSNPPNLLVTGDVDGDGIADLVTNTSGGTTLKFLYGDGRGGVSGTSTLDTGGFATAALLHDFNGDGRADVATLNNLNNQLTVWLSGARGVFAAPLHYETGPAATQLRVGDFNNDGRLDIAAFGRTSNYAIFLNNFQLGGPGGLIPSAMQTLGTESHDYLQSAVGDVDGDGKADLLLTDYKLPDGLTLLLALGDGQGGFAAPRRLPFNVITDAFTLADVNYDGRADWLYVFGDELRVALSAGDGTFGAPVTYALGSRHTDLLLRDFNQDGKVDAALPSAASSTVTILHGQGDGTFAAPLTVPAFGTPSLLAAADFNRDGAIDLAVGQAGAITGGILFNRALCLPPNALVAASAASFSLFQFAPQSIAAIFGANLTTTTQTANALPLPTQLGGVSLRLRDSLGVERLAPLFFVSPTQVNCEIPAGTASGVVLVSLLNGPNVVASGIVTIGPVAPSLFTATASGAGWAAGVVLRVKADNTQVFTPVALFDPSGRLVPLPIELGDEREQVYLLLFGTGLRGRSAPEHVKAQLNGVELPAAFAGPQGDLAGLDQVNLLLPRSLAGSGAVRLQLIVDGVASNPVGVVIY
jgi:uncharacterized protein (TIGR03437 family)